jgi:hypothetical protein
MQHLRPMDAPLCCTIRSGGTLDPEWSDRLGGMVIRASTARGRPRVELSGPLPDQAALVGILVSLYNLGLPLISVACRTPRGVPEPAGEPPDAGGRPAPGCARGADRAARGTHRRTGSDAPAPAGSVQADSGTE